MPGVAIGGGMRLATDIAAEPSKVREFVLRQSRNLFIELLVMLSSTIICIVSYLGGSADVVNYLAPATMLGVGGIANFNMVRQDPNTLLTPLFATRLIAIVVFGIGAMSHNFISGMTQSSFDYMMVTNAEDVARVNLLWLGGMDAMLFGLVASMQMFGGLHVRATTFNRQFSFNTALALLWIGSGSNLLLFTSLNLPNLINNLALALQLAGMFLMARTSSNKISSYTWIGISLLLLIIMSLFFMNKSIVLYPILALVLGFISMRFNFVRIAIGGAMVFGLFVMISPIVSQLRIDHYQSHGSLGDISFSEQVDAISMQKLFHRDESAQANSSTSRLNYVVPAAFAMNQYDSGLKIDTIANSAAALIPRALWPEKPTLTTGNEVNYRMGFQSINSIGVTVFADIYWNIGWFGLSLAFGLGIYTGLITIISRELMRMEDWFMLPFVMAAFRMGIGLDGEFVAGILVPSVVNLVLYFLLRTTENFLSHRG